MAFVSKQHVTPTTMVILHVDDSELVCDVIDGRPYKMAPAEPYEVPIHVGKAIIKHIGHLHGIVEVRQVRTKSGIDWDVETAMAEAQKFLAKCEKEIVEFYVRQQLEDRIAHGKPPLPPTGRAALIIVNNNISLKKQYGLSPLGWTDPGESVPNGSAPAPANEAVQALSAVVEQQRQTINTLQERLDKQSEQFEKLMAMLQGGAETTNTDVAGE